MNEGKREGKGRRKEKDKASVSRALYLTGP